MFTRLLIRLRWPMAWASALLLVAMTISLWFDMSAATPLGIGYWQFSARACSGALNFFLEASGERYGIEPTFRGRFVYRAYWASELWWLFKVERGLWGHPGSVSIYVSAWAVALPPMTIASLGFWANRRRRVPSECVKCRHPLHGATRCPECGRAAARHQLITEQSN